MYAVTFGIEVGTVSSSDWQESPGRFLMKSLGDLPGFVNFVALQDDEGHVKGICICEDLTTLNDVKQIVERWRLNASPLSVSNVVAQRGL